MSKDNKDELGHKELCIYIKNENGTGYNLSPNYTLVLEWYTVDGTFHTEFFCTRDASRGHFDVSYVHVWDNPSEGLRKFLSHCPLHNIKVYALNE